MIRDVILKSKKRQNCVLSKRSKTVLVRSLKKSVLWWGVGPVASIYEDKKEFLIHNMIHIDKIKQADK